MFITSALLLAAQGAWSAETKGRSTPARTGKATESVGNAAMGKVKAESERCIECHGEDGNGAGHSNGPEGKFPKLAGQHPAYILKQIRDFRSGARLHDQMAIMARSVSDEDVLDIAAYFASQTTTAGDGASHPIGQALFEQGDPARGVVACASCHGPRGRGPTASPLTPRLGGQEWRYLDKQLQDWRSGERRNAPDGVMNKVLQPLSAAEIESLTNYLAAQ
ncbi:MAG: c-type cytochrome [Aquabacterium sp.]